MPSRRTVLSGVACTLVPGCSRLGDQSSGDATPTSTTVVASPVDAETVPETVTVGVFPETAADVSAATRDPATAVTEHDWAAVLREFGCFAFDGEAYTITEQTTGSGGYVNEYSVTEVNDPGNESTVRVTDLPDSDRRAAIDAIAAGEHTYDSDVGGFDPNSSVYVYNGSYYVFSLDVHGDKPVPVTYVLDATDRDRCVGLEGLSLDDAQAESLDTTLQPDEASTITGDAARTLAASDVAFVVRGSTCYELSTPSNGTAT